MRHRAGPKAPAVSQDASPAFQDVCRRLGKVMEETGSTIKVGNQGPYIVPPQGAWSGIAINIYQTAEPGVYEPAFEAYFRRPGWEFNDPDQIVEAARELEQTANLLRELQMGTPKFTWEDYTRLLEWIREGAPHEQHTAESGQLPAM